MARFFLIFLISVPFSSFGQKTIFDSTAGPKDTLTPILIKKQPSYPYFSQLNHKEATLGNKIERGCVYVAAYDLTVGFALAIVPENVSKWDKKAKLSIEAELRQFTRTYSYAPVIDKDLFVVNYVGHPYQGSFYYNALRSQGTTVLQSSLYCLANSTLWEYVFEGGTEQPSIQDLIITPIAGSILGELTHVLTIKMSKNGFRWYEAVIVCLINPAYVLNNGLRAKGRRNLDL